MSMMRRRNGMECDYNLLLGNQSGRASRPGNDPLRSIYGVHMLPRIVWTGAESLKTSSSSSCGTSRQSSSLIKKLDTGITSVASLQRTFFLIDARAESRRKKQPGFVTGFGFQSSTGALSSNSSLSPSATSSGTIPSITVTLLPHEVVSLLRLRSNRFFNWMSISSNGFWQSGNRYFGVF